MSLINDALKRVKEAQHKAPPSAELGPQLRPVEPVPVPAHHGLGWLLPIALIGVTLLTLLLLWELAWKENSPVVVRAQRDVPAQSPSEHHLSLTPARSSETVQPGANSTQGAPAVPTAPRSASVASVGSTNAASSASAANSVPITQANASPVQESLASTNSGTIQPADPGGQAGGTNPTIAEAQPLPPPPLKLQGIVFSKRPSAVINGKTVFIGDRVREFRVVAITQDTAILVGAGRTNALSLSE